MSPTPSHASAVSLARLVAIVLVAASTMVALLPGTASGQSGPTWSAVLRTDSVPTGVGDTLEYELEVTNTGAQAIVRLAIADASCATPPDMVDELLTHDGVLEPGETQVWACTSPPIEQYHVDAGGVLGWMALNATPVGGGVLDDLTADLWTPIAAPSWTASLAVPVGPAPTLGDTLTYSTTVVNTGNVTISRVAVRDAKCATTPALTSESLSADGMMEPGETQVWSCDSTPVTQDEIDAGSIDNSVRVEGTPEDGVLDPAIATLSISVTGAPALVIDLAAPPTVRVGETIDYTATVDNAGNVSIVRIAVVDEVCPSAMVLRSESGADDGVLSPGETQEWACRSAVIAAGTTEVTNTATVSGTPLLGVLADASGTVTTTVEASATPALRARMMAIQSRFGSRFAAMFEDRLNRLAAQCEDPTTTRQLRRCDRARRMGLIG